MTTGGMHARRGKTVRNILIGSVALGVLSTATVVTLASQDSPAATAPKTHPKPLAQTSTTAPPVKVSPTAETIAARMRLRGVKAYTARTDLNHLLGRRHEYTSKINWGPGLDSSIEVFGNVADAQNRQQYVGSFGCPFGDGYDYRAGTALLRVSCDASPNHAHRLAARFRAVIKHAESS